MLTYVARVEKESISVPIIQKTTPELIEDVLEEVLGVLFPKHPYRRHFKHHGRPRLHMFVLTRRGHYQTMATKYLNAPITVELIHAIDQYGFPYTGADLAATTVTSSIPADVGATIGAFDANGTAELTLTQAGGEGLATVTVTNGAAVLVLDVQSYVPVLTSFTDGGLLPVAPATTTG